MWSTTSSTVRFVVSISSASSAGCIRSASLLVAGAEVGRERVGADLRPLGQPAARAHLRIGLEVDLHRRSRGDDGADVAALDHRIALLAQLALALPHHLAHLGMPGHDRDEPVDLGPADRSGDVGAAR